MSRSSPPPSTTTGRGPQDDLAAYASGTSNGPSLRRKLNLRLAALMRWTHIYFSMFGLAVLLFFSVTGMTVNHPDWFYGGAERNVQLQGNLNVRWLNLDVPRTDSGNETDAERQV